MNVYDNDKFPESKNFFINFKFIIGKLCTCVPFIFILEQNNSKSLRGTKIKPLDELLKMSKEELLQYLKESESSMLSTDSVQIVPFEHGTKILYFHKDQMKPYKTRAYLNKIEDSESLK